MQAKRGVAREAIHISGRRQSGAATILEDLDERLALPGDPADVVDVLGDLAPAVALVLEPIGGGGRGRGVDLISALSLKWHLRLK